MPLRISCDRTHSSVLILGGSASGAVRIDQLTEFGELGGRELASFDEVNGEAAGGAIEDAFDEFADERASGGGLRHGGGPCVAAAAGFGVDRFSSNDAFVEHHAEHGGDGGGGDIALA